MAETPRTGRMGERVLENACLRVRVMPERGGKLVSVLEKKHGFEALFQPGSGYPPLVPGMPFSEGDASGFDDVFPSMGETFREREGAESLVLPDHGEIWTSAMRVTEESPEAVGMETRGRVLPYVYRKRISLRGRDVCMDIRIRNTGGKAFPLVWVGHGLLRMEKSMAFLFPGESRGIEWTAGCGFPEDGEVRTRVDDPVYGLPEPLPEGKMMKFYFLDPVREGRCAALYPDSGMRVELRFDASRLPYLGFWATTGGYRGERNFAFEPATAWYDTWERAMRSGKCPLLAPGEEAGWTLSLSVSEAEG